MKGLKLLGFIFTIVGAVAGVASECIDRAEDKEFIKKEVAKQIEESKES